jgi:RNA polymerase subunit RPABC4/transcription elongation factor Spt4
MNKDIPPTCSRHKVSKEWRTTTFEYREGEISVKVPGVYGWVCPVDNEASFTPETTDELILTVRELIEPAKRARARRSSLTEYVVKTG